MSYPAKMVMRARVLREEVAGEPLYTLRETADLLAREFPKHSRPSEYTVKMWTDAQFREWKLGEKRRYRAERNCGRLGTAQHGTECQEARAITLARDLELPPDVVAAVMALDFPAQGWTVDRVRELLPADERAIAALYRAGRTADEIADMFGLNAKTVYRRLEAAGVPRRGPGRRPKAAVA